jgi:hypothetical protein
MSALKEASKITKLYAVITYWPQWDKQETGYAQARSFAGYFASYEQIREHAFFKKAGVDGWKKELLLAEVPPVIADIPHGKRMNQIKDPAELLNGYLVKEIEVYSENGTEAWVLGPRIKLEKS